MIKIITSALCLALCFFSTYAQTYATHGMVVSDDAYASQVGVDILKQGGNAIDAAVATALALAVTFPQAGNIGGGGFLVYMPHKGEVTTIDFREKATMSATENMFLDAEGILIPGSNHKGLKTVGVPGTVAGLYLAHQKYGQLPWAALVQPAVDLADQGVPLSYTLASHAKTIVESDSPDFLKQLFTDKNNAVLGFGDIWRQPELAMTLAIIRDRGEDGFYKGEVAQALVDYMEANGGLITKKDLKDYKAIERKPVKGTYKSYDIYTMPPPSSGGVALVEMMNMMELVDLDSTEFNTTAYFHLLTEVMRRAFADRAEFLGDPDFNNAMPLDRLTSKAFAQQRMAHLDWDQASVSDPLKFGQIYDGDNTTHLSVVDADGSAVSLTYTIEQSYGSGMGSPELGFLLNNEMGDFNPQNGYTDRGWLIGTAPNKIEPGKRMLSSMTPTIVAKEGKPYLIIGSPGGRTIINTVFQTVLAVLAYDMPMREAIEAVKIHHQWFPDELIYEKDKLSPDLVKTLESMGHHPVSRDQLGRLMGIFVNQVLIGASDSSSPDGAAIGY